MRDKRALITGITGQDGSYLAEHLLSLGYEVHGMMRRSSTFNTSRIDHIFDKIDLHFGDMNDGTSIMSILHEAQPTEIYNLAAQSHVKVSFELPEYTAASDGLGVLKLLEAVRNSRFDSKIYQASTSEMYGGQDIGARLHETSPMIPRSPYACSKLFAHHICQNYREAYGMHVSNGILFNHESPRRGETFVTRKITKAVAQIAAGKQDFMTLGNIHAVRDWGHARDYVKAMHLMLQQDEPDDYVIATGYGTTVKRFAELAFEAVGIQIEWRFNNHNEIVSAVEVGGNEVIKLSQQYFRPLEVHHLIGDPLKAEEKLGWTYDVNVSQLAKEMVQHDFEEALK